MKDRRLKTERRRLRSTISKGIKEGYQDLNKKGRLKRRGRGDIMPAFVAKCYFLFHLENNCLLYL